MTRIGVSFAGIGVICVGLGVAAPAFANDIERACIKSDRAAGNRSICGCIQDAANLTLTNKDQRLAATFFADPHRAQEIRQSDRRQHESFWQRYKNFGLTAETYCRR